MSKAEGRILPEDLGFGLLFDAIRDAVVVGDLGSETIVAWNNAAQQIFGYTQAEAIGASLDLLTPHNLKAPHKAGLERARTSWDRRILDVGRPMALRAIAKDGTLIDIEMTLGSLGDGYALAIIRDVTERATAEEQLERFFALSPDLLCVASLDGRFLKVNQAWEGVLGFTEDELVSVPFLDFVHPDDVAATLAAMDDLSESRPVISFENRYRTKSGDFRWMQWNANPVVERGLIYAVARDVTDQKGIHQELARHVDELARSDTLKTRFIADAAHELRQPLATLSGYAHLLTTRRATMTPEQQQQAFDALERQSEHVNNLIGDLLDLSQIEREHLTIAMTTVDVAAAVERALEVAPAPPGKHVAVTIPPGTAIHADGGRLDQVLINLITNAYRYGGDGIEIGAATSAATTTITLSDNGEGIPEPFVANMFEPFARGSNTSTVRGSGLGLAIVKKIITAFGGDVRYETNEPHGARFVLTLPTR